jgi:hypothetical protein
MVRRRALLAGAAAGAALLAGCASSPGGGPRVDRRIVVNEDSYARFAFEVPGTGATIDYAVAVVDGPAIDALLVPADRAPRLATREAVAFDEAGSRLATRSASASASLPPGEWLLVVDNSDRGRALPPSDFRNSEATVDVRYAVE